MDRSLANQLVVIRPDWPAPENVVAIATTRHGGVSKAPHDSLNLGENSGDDPNAVAENRCRLERALDLPSTPRWLKQVHGTVAVDAAATGGLAEADASFTTQAKVVCSVLSADCLPVLFCDKQGRCVAAAHAGWRGLLAGLLEQTVRQLPVHQQELLAWLGPAIGPEAFEVGSEVRADFIRHDRRSQACFQPSPGGRWLADIYALAKQRLVAVGVGEVFGGEHCTAKQAQFFSYRRDGVTGRQASLIYLR